MCGRPLALRSLPPSSFSCILRRIRGSVVATFDLHLDNCLSRVGQASARDLGFLVRGHDELSTGRRKVSKVTAVAISAESVEEFSFEDLKQTMQITWFGANDKNSRKSDWLSSRRDCLLC
jgi:hypothetical protein